jgi:hypothetical protein
LAALCAALLLAATLLMLSPAGNAEAGARAAPGPVIAARGFQFSANSADTTITGTAAVAIVPAGGKHRGIRLRSQTVDVAIKQDASGVWADTRIWIQLDNAGSNPINVPVTLPGPRLLPSELPADLKVESGKGTMELQPLPEAEAGDGPGLAAEIGLPARKALELRLSYRQALPETGGLLTYVYYLTALNAWAGTPESLRLTLRFDPSINPRQVLSVLPAPHRSDSGAWTWDWENERAGTDIGVAFMSSAWWAEFSAARAAASAPGAGTVEHLALSQYYQHLLALPELPFEQPGFFERYYAPAVAELQTAATTGNGTAPADDLIAVHMQLAGLYRRQADRLGPGPGDTYQQLAADEIGTALSLGASGQPARELAADLYGQLAARARAREDEATAQDYERRLSALGTPQGITSPDSQQSDISLAAAEEAVARGDLSAARQIIQATFGPETADPPGLEPPRASQSVVTVVTSPPIRVITVTLVPLSDQDTQAVAVLLRQAANLLRGQPGVSADARGNRMVITSSFSDTQQLAETQHGLVEALPDAPELALLASVLAPASISWTADNQQPLYSTQRYFEQVDLQAAWQTWQSLAGRLAAAGRELEAGQANTSSTGELAQARRVLWTADAAAWRALAADSRAEYKTELHGPTVQREWIMPAGASQTLELTASRWHLEHVRWAAIGAGLLLLLLAAAIWRWT